ncbi:hypothetical protein PHJA_002153800 [Phtheirospermum japonicum]|uniref:Uncharacterized protein n=1 Tax=Phtheirospermum japonicum TaxID=374723 RepID=A0A830CHB4_9LAMI|nr:hypothetical protein PHJA_002153800 [Phtheirospermum japonicum]
MATGSQPSVIPISTHHHLPIKLTQTHFPSWRTHLCALLNGFSLIGHIDGSSPSPDAVIAPDAYRHWFKQDQLLLAAILGSVLPDILPIISVATTAAEAFSTLSSAFASKSRAHVMFLKTSLTNASLEGKSISDYVNRIKSLADELGLIDGSVKSDDLTLYIVNGLTPEYRDIVSAVRTRDTPFCFEELRDRLIEHELYLKQIESKIASLVATANVAQSVLLRPSVPVTNIQVANVDVQVLIEEIQMVVVVTTSLMAVVQIRIINGGVLATIPLCVNLVVLKAILLLSVVAFKPM